MKQETAQQLPDVAFRAAIHNQIYNTRYFHVSRYERNPETGKLAHTESWGYRNGAKGGRDVLGMTSGQARYEAQQLNSRHGWAEIPKEQRPKWLEVAAVAATQP